MDDEDGRKTKELIKEQTEQQLKNDLLQIKLEERKKAILKRQEELDKELEAEEDPSNFEFG